MSANTKGASNMPLANNKGVGMQGAGGVKGGSEVYAVSPSKGQVTPKKIGGGMGSLVQAPVQPKVGK